MRLFLAILLAFNAFVGLLALDLLIEDHYKIATNERGVLIELKVTHAHMYELEMRTRALEKKK